MHSGWLLNCRWQWYKVAQFAEGTIMTTVCPSGWWGQKSRRGSIGGLAMVAGRTGLYKRLDILLVCELPKALEEDMQSPGNCGGT